MYECYRSPTQILLLPAIQHHNRECCTPRASSSPAPWRTCDHQTTRAISTSSCKPRHITSQDLVRTTAASPACQCYEVDICNYRHCCQCWPLSFSSATQSTSSTIETLLCELLSVCIKDETCECICERAREDCTACATESQSLICELMDLLERVRCTERSALGTGLSWRCTSSHGRGWGCCTIADRDREIKTETQTLFDVLLRITRRRTYRASSGSRSRGGMLCSRAGERHTGLSKVVKQLLDELEMVGGCGCHSCHEYFEVNTRRVRKSLREIEGQCGRRQGGGGVTARRANAWCECCS